MGKSHAEFLVFIIAAAIIAMSFTFVYGQDPAIEGSYKVTLKLPKAEPTVILTFCPGSNGVPFTGAWFETDETNSLAGEMTSQKINGKELSFRVTVGPGEWDFVCTIEGDTLKGTITGDGATSGFEGPLIEFAKEKDFCTK